MSIGTRVFTLYHDKLAVGIISKADTGASGPARLAAECVAHRKVPSEIRPKESSVKDVKTGWASLDPITQELTFHGKDKPKDPYSSINWDELDEDKEFFGGSSYSSGSNYA